MPGPTFTDGPCEDVISISIPETAPNPGPEQACPWRKKLNVERGILDSENEVFDPEVANNFIEPDLGTEESEDEVVVAGFQGETPNICETE